MDDIARGRKMMRQNRKAGAVSKITSESARAALNYAREQFPGRVVTESYLRLELPASTSNVLQFKVLENEGSAAPSEKRLNVADNFVVTHVGFYNFPTANIASNAASVMPLTYVNDGAYGGANDDDFMKALYNGFMTIRKNSTVFFDAIEMMNFVCAGTAQIGNPTNDWQSDAWNGENGYKKIQPYMIFSGTAKNDVTITVPNQGVTLTTLAARVAVVFRGFLVQGATTK